jgi:hypothetical protein
MTRLMSCDEFAERLSDFLERDSRVMDDATRASMEVHARSCNACGALVTDLRELRVAAGGLPTLAPSRDLWAGIAARIETPVVELNAGRLADGAKPISAAPAQSGRRVDRRVWLGLAAAALVGVTATVTREMTRRPAPLTAPVAASSTPSRVAARPIDSVKAPVAGAPAAAATNSNPSTSTPAPAAVTRLASNAQPKVSPEQTYDREIASLRIIVDRRQSELDSSTVTVITHNLRIIDDAIAQCRTALKKDPASRFLMQSLDQALDTKIQLMRTVAMLPSST